MRIQLIASISPRQQVLQQTLPSQVFTLLIQRMREYGGKAAAAEESSAQITDDINDDLE